MTDYAKAFDVVNKSTFLEILNENEITLRLVNVIKGLYHVSILDSNLMNLIKYEISIKVDSKVGMILIT